MWGLFGSHKSEVQAGKRIDTSISMYRVTILPFRKLIKSRAPNFYPIRIICPGFLDNYQCFSVLKFEADRTNPFWVIHANVKLSKIMLLYYYTSKRFKTIFLKISFFNKFGRILSFKLLRKKLLFFILFYLLKTFFLCYNNIFFWKKKPFCKDFFCLENYNKKGVFFHWSW